MLESLIVLRLFMQIFEPFLSTHEDVSMHIIINIQGLEKCFIATRECVYCDMLLPMFSEKA